MSPIYTAAILMQLAAPAAPPVDAAVADQLSKQVRELLLQNMPTPVYEKDKDWGKTKEVKVIRLRHSEVVIKTAPKNDGLWRKIRVEAVNPKDNLVFQLRDITPIEPGKIALTIRLASDINVDATQEHWESGLKLYGASIRARAKAQITLKCELVTKTEIKNLLPEIVCKVKVTNADVTYDKLVVEHLAGLGGTAAKVLGATGHELIHQWKPSIERDLLEKANEAVTKAVEKKEIRVGFDKLLKK